MFQQLLRRLRPRHETSAWASGGPGGVRRVVVFRGDGASVVTDNAFRDTFSAARRQLLDVARLLTEPR
jgi:hypothetical protein